MQHNLYRGAAALQPELQCLQLCDEQPAEPGGPIGFRAAMVGDAHSAGLDVRQRPALAGAGVV